MKHCIFAVVVFAAITSFSCVKEKKEKEMKIYPPDFQVRVWPEEIRYGDACFLTFSVTNQGEETLLLPYGKTFLKFDMMGQFLHGEKILMDYSSSILNNREGEMCHTAFSYTFPYHSVKPGETMDFHVRMLWFPLPEYTHEEPAKELLELVDQEANDFVIRWYIRSKWHTQHVVIEKPIRILPRSAEETKLIQDWYLEMPSTRSRHWTMEHVLAHPHHATGSPYKMTAPTGREVEIKRKPFDEDFEKFYASMQTRTPEVVKRIERTNELAAKIVERSKEPNSTISRNMAEFVQLRGFLVDMRYAENPEAEEAAFIKLMDFVEKSQDKKLWTHFVHEIALGSILNYEHFPSKKVQTYRERFAERFHIVGRDGW